MEILQYVIDNFKIKQEQDEYTLDALRKCMDALHEKRKAEPPAKCLNSKCKKKLIDVPYSVQYCKGYCRTCCPPKDKEIFFYFEPQMRQAVAQAQAEERQSVMRELQDQQAELKIKFVKQPRPGMPKVMTANIQNVLISS